MFDEQLVHAIIGREHPHCSLTALSPHLLCSCRHSAPPDVSSSYIRLNNAQSNPQSRGAGRRARTRQTNVMNPRILK